MEPIEMTNNHYYFLLDTDSLIPNTYYLDILATSNLVTTLKKVVHSILLIKWIYVSLSNMKKLIKKLLREEISKCVQLFPTDEVINYIKNFDSDEQLLRSGGLPTIILDRYAFGFSEKI
jgi:hypothetical protein